MHDQPDDSLQVAVNSLKHLRIEMTEASRRHLVSRCAQVTPVSRSRLLLLRIQEFLSLAAPQRALAVSMGLVVLLGGAALLFSVRPDFRGAPAIGGSQVQLVSLRPDASGRVTLEWRDGSQRTYRVLKSHNPRDFSRADSYEVRGNRWTDRDLGVGRVTYYRVE